MREEFLQTHFFWLSSLLLPKNVLTAHCHRLPLLFLNECTYCLLPVEHKIVEFTRYERTKTRNGNQTDLVTLPKSLTNYKEHSQLNTTAGILPDCPPKWVWVWGGVVCLCVGMGGGVSGWDFVPLPQKSTLGYLGWLCGWEASPHSQSLNPDLRLSTGVEWGVGEFFEVGNSQFASKFQSFRTQFHSPDKINLSFFRSLRSPPGVQKNSRRRKKGFEEFLGEFSSSPLHPPHTLTRRKYSLGGEGISDRIEKR